MKEEKNIWIEKVMASHKGKILLDPSPSLFENIQKRTNKAKLISLRQLTIAGVAASLLILINSVAIQSINTTYTSESADIAYDDQLISDYNLYQYE